MASEARPQREEPLLQGGAVGDLKGERKGECLDEERPREEDRLLPRLGLLAILKKE